MNQPKKQNQSESVMVLRLVAKATSAMFMRVNLLVDVDHRVFHKRESRQCTGENNSIRFLLKPTIQKNLAFHTQ